MTFDDLKLQKRWIMWKREKTKDGKDTKVPYQVSGGHAMSNNPATWSTYAECREAIARFTGIGLVLGDGVWGVDIDKCADAISGDFTQEARKIIIELNTYAEYSPSGTGCHILGLGTLPGPGYKRPFGNGAIEIKAENYYYTFTERHLRKTPADLIDRQTEITALYNRFLKKETTPGLSLSVPANEAERFKKLWAGDCSDFDGDHSRADFALCGILMRRFNNNFYKADEEFRKSGLYRDKWEREDYRMGIFLKLLAGKPAPALVIDSDPIDEDGPDEYLVEALDEYHEGWFPKAEISLVGGSSGTGKTSLLIPLLEKVRLGEEVFGHKTKPRDYGVLLHDRSRRAMRRTAKALRLSDEAIARVARLTPEQQRSSPADILEAAIASNPKAEAWLIEGLDMWIPKITDMDAVSQVMDGLQRVATRHNIAVIATVGSPKQKKGEGYSQHRDSLLGSSALGRKAETVVLMELNDAEDPNSVRRCTLLCRCGPAERFFFEWQKGNGLVLTTAPEAVPEETAVSKMEKNVIAKFQPGDMITYSAELGSQSAFYRWRTQAAKEGKIVYSGGLYFIPRARDEKPN